MTDITARAFVRCPFHQADRRLARFLEDHVRGERAVIELEVRPGSTAHAIITARRDPAAPALSYAVTWTSEACGAYPTFVGQLWAAQAGDDDGFELILEGRAERPLGVGATGFDQRGTRGSADLAAERLVAAIAASIEARPGS